jgi:hypothetical protein
LYSAVLLTWVQVPWSPDLGADEELIKGAIDKHVCDEIVRSIVTKVCFVMMLSLTYFLIVTFQATAVTQQISKIQGGKMELILET